MHCASIFTCVMTMISNFLIVFISKEFFKESFPTNITFFYILCDFNSFLVSDNIFLFSKSVTLFAFSLKDSQNFFIQFFGNIKCVCLPCDQIPKLLTLNTHKEYARLSLLFQMFLDHFHTHLFFN